MITQMQIARAKAMGKPVWDRGLGFRPTKDGRGSWVVQWSVKGKDHLLTLGRGDIFTPKQAWDMARDVLGKVARGEDPRPEKYGTTDQLTLKNVAQQYLVLEGHKLRSLPKRTRDLNRWMAEYGDRAMRDIRRGDVVAFLDKLEADKGVNAAQSALVAFSSLATWYAVRDEQYETPVVRGMARVNPKEQRRHRTLTDDELRALWASTDTEHPYNCLVRFLLLTAMRLEEACDMKRQEVSADGVWTIPAERMKAKQPHVVPLSDWALDAFHRVPVVGVSPYVFTITGRSSISGYTKFKEGLDARMARYLGDPVAHWVHHDLRRTFITKMNEHALADPHIIEACTAHIIGGVKAHYNHATYFQAKKAAFAAWGNYVANIIFSGR